MVASAEYKSSRRLGPAGSKEGPYNYAPPAYWWDAGPHMSSGGDFTNAGGAFGFDTEASPGNTIPTLDSLARFLSDRGQAAIWNPASTHGLGSGPALSHTSPYSDYTGIARLGQYNTALWRRYGPWSNMATYQREAQAGGYEVTRALFEAYIGHSQDRANPSTGIIYWQLNKAWPSLQWELYGYDLDQTGVYFGAKKANEPVHALYAYDRRTVKVANLTNTRQTGLRLRAELIDLAGRVRLRRTAQVPALGSQDVRSVLGPLVPPPGTSPTYFLRLRLLRGAEVLSRNVYWLSTKPDLLDWSHTIGKGTGAAYAPGGYADLTGLRQLPPAPVEVRATSHGNGADGVTTVIVTNTGHRGAPAFLVRADVRRGGTQGDDQVLPILWTDNDVTLWPGESVTLVARYRSADLRGALPVVSVSGWNARLRLAAAPAG
jgi:exo-1,4-beta-D-glucosaminidase